MNLRKRPTPPQKNKHLLTYLNRVPNATILSPRVSIY